jgi:hypothetical protein
MGKAMPDTQSMRHLEALLRNSPLVRGGFLGHDERPLEEILQADQDTLLRLGVTAGQIAQRMAELTSEGKSRFGAPVSIPPHLTISSDEYKGRIDCPWPDCSRFDKRVTTACRSDLGQCLRWTDLNIHLIGDHGFFEGRGSAFRLEPDDLIRFLF